MYFEIYIYIYVIELDKISCPLNPEHSSNAQKSMLLTESGITKSPINPLQKQNAY